MYWTGKNKTDSELLTQRVSELEDLVTALLPENALITANGYYVTSLDGKYLITI